MVRHLTWLSCAACGFSGGSPDGGAPIVDGRVDGADARSDARDGDAAGCARPAFRGSSTATAPSSTSFTIGDPPGAQAGDVLVAIILYEADNDETPDPLDLPSGWTLIRQDQFAGVGSIGQAMFWRVASAGGSTHQFDSQHSKRFAAAIQAYTGADAANPIAAQGGQTGTSSTAVQAPGIAATICNVVVGGFGIKSLATFTAPTPMTERADINNGDGATIALEGTDEAADGAVGPRTATASVAGQNIGQLVALRPP